MTEEPCKCPENMREALPLAAYEAAMEGRVQHVRAWLNAGGDVNATTMLSDKLGPGMSLLAAACYQGQADVVRELLKNPMTHLNTRHNTECGMNCTPMYIAAHSGYDNCISALLTSKLKRLSVAIQRGNAHCIHGSCPPSEELEEMFNL
ncbi:uncharacterized protein [Procambarus clarkii]|uniref:uncharacterized protein isoform X4 n=1 Tax=Procambarus clarkii TaxID=6728 RepID=UPI0037426039